MKMEVWVLLLILSSVLCVSADVQHGDNWIIGCSDAYGDFMQILDDEAVWYIDFIKQTVVDSLPNFADPIGPPGQYEQAVSEMQMCKQNLNTFRHTMKDVPKELDPPSSLIIYTVLNVELGVQNTLICHVTGFYPAPVNVIWTKNEQKVTEGMNTSVPFPNKDGSFKQTSRLDFIPKQGDVYSCTVEHVALTQPMTKFYDNAAGHVTVSSGFKSSSQSDCQSLSELGNMASTLLCFTLLFIILCTADGYELYTSFRCLFNSTELKDIEFITSYYYNRLEYVRFSSNVGKFVGYTEYGVREAENWNKDQAILAQMRAQKETYCQHNIGIWYTNVLSKSVKPSVRLHSTMAPGCHHPAMLVCSVYDFYPKLIKVSWLRNGQEITSDITSTEEFANGDWLYQVHSHLEYMPRSGEKISCMVEHASLEKPLIINWVPPMPETERLIIVGVVGLILGLILFLAGVIYRRKSGDTSLAHRFSEKQAEDWSKDAAALSLWRPQKEKFFKPDSELCFTNVLPKSVMPLVRLHSMTPPGGRHPALALCRVYDFFPKQPKTRTDAGSQ